MLAALELRGSIPRFSASGIRQVLGFAGSFGDRPPRRISSGADLSSDPPAASGIAHPAREVKRFPALRAPDVDPSCAEREARDYSTACQRICSLFLMRFQTKNRRAEPRLDAHRAT